MATLAALAATVPDERSERVVKGSSFTPDIILFVVIRIR